ncbi:MAG: hypothetical protein IT436_00955 [Phycisphaerales bacterium]|nr:hypothetical protein [Phycisphaerales bacterium]
MKKLMIGMVSIAALAGAAGADVVNVRFTGTARGGNYGVVFNGSGMNVFAGQLKHTLSGGTGVAAGLSGEHTTFCTDLYQYVTSTTLTYDVVPLEALPSSSPMGAGRAAALLDIYTTAAGAQLSSSASNDYASAFQLAVWEIATDYNPNVGPSSLNISSGNFRATKTDGSPVSSAVQGYLSTFFAVVGAPRTGSDPDILGLRSGSNQDQLVQVPGPGSAVIAGLGGLLAVGRRRKAS